MLPRRYECGKRLSRHLTLLNDLNRIVTRSNKSDAATLLMASGTGRAVGTDRLQSAQRQNYVAELVDTWTCTKYGPAIFTV